MTAIGATVTFDLLNVIVAQIHCEDVISHIRSCKQYKPIRQPVTKNKQTKKDKSPICKVIDTRLPIFKT